MLVYRLPSWYTNRWLENSVNIWNLPFGYLVDRLPELNKQTNTPLEVIHFGLVQPKFAVAFLTNRFIALCGEFGKGIEMVRPRFFLDGPLCFCFLCVCVWESFEARKKRLAAPGSGSQTRESLSTSALTKGTPKQPMTVLFDPRTVTNPVQSLKIRTEGASRKHRETA